MTSTIRQALAYGLTALLATACGSSSQPEGTVGLNSSDPTSLVEARYRNEPIIVEWLGVTTLDAVAYEISACYKNDHAKCYLIYRIECPAELAACVAYAGRDLATPLANYSFSRVKEDGGSRFRFQDLKTPSVGSSLTLKVQGIHDGKKGEEVFALENTDLPEVKND